MIHRYWTGPNEPPVTIGTVWHDDDLPPDVVTWLDTWATRVTPVDRPRHRSNMVRWWLLYHHGGIWLDHDSTPTAPLPDPPWIATLHGHAATCAMGFPPRHTLPHLMLGHIAHKSPDPTAQCPNVSGDRLANQLLAAVPDLPRIELDDSWMIHHRFTASTYPIHYHSPHGNDL